MGTMFNDQTRGGAGVRASQRRGRVQPEYFRYITPHWRPGDAVSWGNGHQGIVEEVLTDEMVLVLEHGGSGRRWRLKTIELRR
jgi:hypothetical protein